MECNPYEVDMEAMVQRVGNIQSDNIKRSIKNNDDNPRKTLEEKWMRMGSKNVVVIKSKTCS